MCRREGDRSLPPVDQFMEDLQLRYFAVFEVFVVLLSSRPVSAGTGPDWVACLPLRNQADSHIGLHLPIRLILYGKAEESILYCSGISGQSHSRSDSLGKVQR